MTDFSTQNLDTAIIKMRDTIDAPTKHGWGNWGLNGEEVIKLMEMLKTQLTSIELHTGYVVAAYKSILDKDAEQNRNFQSLQLNFKDMENQRNAALAHIDDLEKQLDELEADKDRQYTAFLLEREKVYETVEELDQLKRTIAENESRHKDILDAVRESSLRGAELERENDLLNAEIANLEIPDELDEPAPEWKSPQGIWFCRDNADIYGGGRDALWYFDENKDDWMLTCWVGENTQIKQAYREQIERQIKTIDALDEIRLEEKRNLASTQAELQRLQSTTGDEQSRPVDWYDTDYDYTDDEDTDTDVCGCCYKQNYSPTLLTHLPR